MEQAHRPEGHSHVARGSATAAVHRIARTPGLIRTAALGLAVASWLACAHAKDLPGALPGDEALSCDQIYAAGMAESQRDQQARAEKAQALKQKQQGLMGLAGVAMATGGLVGGHAAQAAADDVAKSQGQLADPASPPNARKERLRELWADRHCAAPGSAGGAKPADEAMTCAQIAAEMMPYVNQLTPSLQATASSQRQLNAQASALGERQRAENNALAGMATAGALDPTGIAKRAYQAAAAGLQAKHKSESDALRDSPQARQTQANAEAMVAQSQQLQGDARLQQLMRLGQQKGCDRQ